MDASTSWERAHRVFCPKRRRRPQSGPPRAQKKESWDFSLGAHSAPSARPAVRARRRRGATELVAASDRRASRLEPQAHRARNTQSTHERRDLQEDRTRSALPARNRLETRRPTRQRPRLRAVNRPNHVHPIADPVPNLHCFFLVLFRFSADPPLAPLTSPWAGPPVLLGGRGRGVRRVAADSPSPKAQA